MLDFVNDILYVAEYERGRLYRCEITFMDGTKTIAVLEYDQPVKGNLPLPNGEFLTIPRFKDTYHVLGSNAYAYSISVLEILENPGP